MKISEIFARQSLYSTGNAKDAARVTPGADDEAKGQGSGKADDSVSISAQAKDRMQASHIIADDEQTQSARLSALKQQVASGTYSPDSQKVAESINSYVFKS